MTISIISTTVLCMNHTGKYINLDYQNCDSIHENLTFSHILQTLKHEAIKIKPLKYVSEHKLVLACETMVLYEHKLYVYM